MNQKARHIMLVEDDQEILNIFKSILELEGYQVSTASDGKEALQKLATLPTPGVILLDLMMPVMDGEEFLKIKQADAALRGIPVIVLAAAVGRSMEIEGVSAFLKKPIDIETLLSTLKKYELRF